MTAALALKLLVVLAPELPAIGTELAKMATDAQKSEPAMNKFKQEIQDFTTLLGTVVKIL